MSNTFFDEFVDPGRPGNVVIRAEHYMRYIFARETIKQTGKASVLYDIGCGNGYGLQLLSQISPLTLYGFDASATLLDEAMTRKTPRTKWIHVNLDKKNLGDVVKELDLPSPTVVICFEILEHLEHPLKLLLDIVNLLPRDGLFLLSVPNERFEPKKQGKAKNKFHKQLFSKEVLTSLLHDAGFSKITYYGQPKANRFYHQYKKLLPVADTLTYHLPLFFRFLARRVASVTSDPEEKSYSMLVICRK